MTAAADILALLHSSKKLDRDKGVGQLQDRISKVSQDEVKTLLVAILTALEDGTSSWEAKQGSLMASKLLLHSQHLTNDFPVKLRECCISCLGDEEVRVRSEAGELVNNISFSSSHATVFVDYETFCDWLGIIHCCYTQRVLVPRFWHSSILVFLCPYYNLWWVDG